MTFLLKRISLLILVSLLFFVNQSCNKEAITTDGSNAQTRGGIALTIDDNYIDNWHQYLGLFDSLGVKVTFYISSYNKLTPAQKVKLHEIQDHGHEIAYHSTNHVNFPKYADSVGCDKLIKDEVLKGLELMNKDGFYPTTFAYPFGQHNDVIDKLLKKQFKSIRALNGTQDLSRSLARMRNNSLIFGLGIDDASKRNLDKIKGLLALAQQSNKCAVLLVHNIERKDFPLQIPLWKLKEIILKAKSLNLKFCTISEISK